MLTFKQGIKLSAVIDKVDIDVDSIVAMFSGARAKNRSARENQMALGFELVLQVARQAHKAEKEIYNFVASVKGCTPAEAENEDLIAMCRGIFSDKDTNDFFTDALASGARDKKPHQKSRKS